MNSYKSDNPIFDCFNQAIGIMEKDSIVLDGRSENEILFKAYAVAKTIGRIRPDNYIEEKEDPFYSPLMKAQNTWKEKMEKLKNKMK